MSRKKIVWDEKGNRREIEGEHASPWLPPEHMRGLPGDYFTQDTSDPDKVHELDDPHIVEALTAEQDKKYVEEEKKSPFDLAAEVLATEQYTEPQFNNRNIAFRRFLIISNLVKGAMLQIERGYRNEVNLAIRHVWYPKPSFNEELLRPGNAPADIERPKHLRGKELFIDINNWPRSIKELMLKRGIELPNIAVLLGKTKKIVDMDIPVDQLPLEGLPQ